MSGNDPRARSVGRKSVIASVEGVLRTHTVNPDKLDDTIAVLCRAIGGMIAVEFDEPQEREEKVQRAAENIREGIAYGLEAQGG